MPVEHQDPEAASGSRRRGALVLALCLVALLVTGSGFAGYVWWTPQALRFGRYALLGPGYRPPPFFNNPQVVVYEFGSEAATAPPSGGMLFLIQAADGSRRYDIGQPRWEWGPFRWVRVLKTR